MQGTFKERRVWLGFKHRGLTPSHLFCCKENLVLKKSNFPRNSYGKAFFSTMVAGSPKTALKGNRV